MPPQIPQIASADQLPEIKPIFALLWRLSRTALWQLDPSATSSAGQVSGNSSEYQNLRSVLADWLNRLRTQPSVF